MDENSKVIIITANDLFVNDLAGIMRDKNVDFVIIDSVINWGKEPAFVDRDTGSKDGIARLARKQYKG